VPGIALAVYNKGHNDGSGEGLTPEPLLQDSQNEMSPAARRILDSEGLRRSGKLKELLAYLLRRAIVSPNTPVSEQNIGAEVYGRRLDYDTTHDTIVRVQIAQLRKKLERYYEIEGARDEQILTIPRGRYLALWRPRVTESTNSTQSTTPAANSVPGKRVRPSALVVALVALCAILLLTIAIMAIGQNKAIRQSPAVASLWSEILAPGKTTQVVLSDPGIVMLSLAAGRRIRFPDLGNRPFQSPLDSINASAEYKSLLRGITSAQLTTLSDLELVRSITELGLSDPGALNVVVARDFRIRDLNSSNSILVGYGLSNPWVEVFQQTINFVLDLDTATNTKSITNLHPNRGEPDRYLLGDAQKADPTQGFATVDLFPNPAHSGKVMIISAVDVPGTEAAIRFLTTESLWAPFYKKIAANGHVPFFEVVLAYRRLSNSSGDIMPVAFRIH
jgi:hypothetical protein